ncbi:hypothetical protein BDN71DRAFT_1396646 [Pleurotus eryngii]|uniref:Uncharacterized protein n=1 Tax=Pleurotus eryngii TaxID=5323 RepID=A0A9P5ZVE3_PLEER|nr:hypothetical protein BDN71DRAFT_1396646 [Pleurotus eryngii]
MDVDVSTTTVDEVITSITTATHLSPSSAIKRPTGLDFTGFAPALTDAPKWLNDAVKHLCPLSPNSEWKEIITRFIKFERSLGFLDGKIPTNMLAPGKHRPKEVGVWIKAGRPNIPAIKSSFGAQWRLWYHELQPESRKANEGHLECIPPPDGEWTELRKGTINSVYSLLASLGWWLKSADACTVSNDELASALTDFS